MENLIMLLDDYEERIVGVHSVWDKINDKETAWIISKKFWFIEQLIKRNQIDLDKVKQEAMSWFTDESPVYWNEIWTDRLIMILSVSNNPISDLVYYLKE